MSVFCAMRNTLCRTMLILSLISVSIVSGSGFVSSVQEKSTGRLIIITDNTLLDGTGREDTLVFVPLFLLALQEEKTPILVSRKIVACYLKNQNKAQINFSQFNFSKWQIFCGLDWVLCVPTSHMLRISQTSQILQNSMPDYQHESIRQLDALNNTMRGFNSSGMKQIVSLSELEHELGIKNIKPEMQELSLAQSINLFIKVPINLCIKPFISPLVSLLSTSSIISVMGYLLFHDAIAGLAFLFHMPYLQCIAPDSRIADLQELKKILLPQDAWNIVMMGPGCPSRELYAREYYARKKEGDLEKVLIDPWAQLAGFKLWQIKDLLEFYQTIGVKSVTFCTCFGGGYHAQLLDRWMQQLEKKAVGGRGSNPGYTILLDTHTDAVSRPPFIDSGSGNFACQFGQLEQVSCNDYFNVLEQEEKPFETSLCDPQGERAKIRADGSGKIEQRFERAAQWITDRRLEQDIQRSRDCLERLSARVIDSSLDNSLVSFEPSSDGLIICPCMHYRSDPLTIPIIRLPGSQGFQSLGNKIFEITENSSDLAIDPKIKVIRFYVPQDYLKDWIPADAGMTGEKFLVSATAGVTGEKFSISVTAGVTVDKLSIPVTIFYCGATRSLPALALASPGRGHASIGTISFALGQGAQLPTLERIVQDCILALPVMYPQRISIGSITCASSDLTSLLSCHSEMAPSTSSEHLLLESKTSPLSFPRRRESSSLNNLGAPEKEITLKSIDILRDMDCFEGDSIQARCDLVFIHDTSYYKLSSGLNSNQDLSDIPAIPDTSGILDTPPMPNLLKPKYTVVKITPEEYAQAISEMDRAIAPVSFWKNPLKAIFSY